MALGSWYPFYRLEKLRRGLCSSFPKCSRVAGETVTDGLGLWTCAFMVVAEGVGGNWSGGVSGEGRMVGQDWRRGDPLGWSVPFAARGVRSTESVISCSLLLSLSHLSIPYFASFLLSLNSLAHSCFFPSTPKQIQHIHAPWGRCRDSQTRQCCCISIF